jgi:hypothetical protein
MTGQRISLSRIIAVNWYGFRQVFDVTNHALIAGAFGTGKTALLDLIQHVLLGEHWRPNRAAAGNARSRSLVSYCLCDTNTVRDGEPHYTRSSGVTVIALEFTWPEERGGRPRRRETWGMRIEFSSPTAEPRRTYFLVPDRLEYAQLAPDGRLLEEDVFRTWIKREFEAGSSQKCLFGRQQDYLAEMATPRHLYFDPLPFQKTLVKAIAFEPEENVEDFIRRFILEESPLDVRDVKAAQDAYRETEARLRRQENEAGFLRTIAGHQADYTSARTEESIHAWLRHALSVAQFTELVERHRSSLERLQGELAEDQKAVESAAIELDALQKVIEATRFEGAQDPGQGKLNDLESRKGELHREIVQLRDAAHSVRQRLSDRHHRWVHWLRHATSLAQPGLVDLLTVDPRLLDTLHGGEDQARLGALQSLSTRFQELVRTIEQYITPIRQERETADQRLRQLAAELESIGKERSPGSFPVFEAIQQRLGGRAHQLGRLIEVRPESERWWPALELFLGRQRWAIVVTDADYREALAVLRRVPPGRETEMLIHPGEVLSSQLRREVREGSLAEKVEVTHPVARAYVHHLLGDVLCVETPEELDSCPAGRAITPDGVFKQLPTRRRLRPAGDVALTLGREGLARMRQLREREQIEVRAQRDMAERRLQDLHAWLDSGLKGGLGDGTLPDRSTDLPRLPKLEADFGSVCETIQLLTTPERAARLVKLKELDDRKTRLDRDIAVRARRLEEFQRNARPHEEGLVRAEDDLRQAKFDLTASRVGVPTRVLDRELHARLELVLGMAPTWDKRKDAVTVLELEARETAANARNARNAARRELVSARDAAGNLLHPQYQTDFVLDDDDNAAWEARLTLLETVELGTSRSLASDRRKDWERRLQEGVLDRLNEKLQAADRTIRELRGYLQQRIGRHVYRITQKRDPAFSALWSLLDTGLSPADPLAQAIQSEEVDRAKAELMAAVEAAERADERGRRLLDYRYYHRYDLEMLSADQPDAPGISLGRSGRSLSGGENQAPFFISMLAAFRRVYDVGSHRSPHLGLVVMDEAFSKLSGDGVEDCLELAGRFELQLIMAFPIDRLGVMAPYADTVVICQKKVTPGADGYVSHIENIPILLTAEQAMEPLT